MKTSISSVETYLTLNIPIALGHLPRLHLMPYASVTTTYDQAFEDTRPEIFSPRTCFWKLCVFPSDGECDVVRSRDEDESEEKGINEGRMKSVGVFEDKRLAWLPLAARCESSFLAFPF